MWLSDDWRFLKMAEDKPEILLQEQIIVVEDDVTLQPALTAIIRAVNEDARIEWHTTADELLSLYSTGTRSLADCGLLLVDINLPGNWNGLDLWQACGKLCPRTPLILMSAISPEEFRQSIIGETELPPYLQKPVSLQRFRELGARLLGRR